MEHSKENIFLLKKQLVDAVITEIAVTLNDIFRFSAFIPF